MKEWVKGEGFKVKGEKIESYEDLEVYQRLCQLHLEINEETLKFPKFELRPMLRKAGTIGTSIFILRRLIERWERCRKRYIT
jgi:hypothetical protein